MAIDSPRIQALLAYLLLHRGAPVSRQQLAYLFWPDSSDQQARTNLRQLLHRLRRELPEADRCLHIAGASLQWQSDAPVRLDVADFEAALAAASEATGAGVSDRALATLQEAVNLYHGDLLPDCYDEWVLAERERLRQHYVAALSQLTSLLESIEKYDQAITYARRLLAQDDLQEKGYRQLMRLYALAGNRAAALRVYHNCATVLERELGVAPGPETRQMYETLLAASAPARPVGGEPPALVVSSALVGRQQEWLALQQAWQAATERTHVVLLAGEAGIGKTRLAEQFVQWAARQGIATATARCYAGEGSLAYAPIAAWLRSEALRPALATLDPVWLAEITRIVPELAAGRRELAPQEVAGESWEQGRFFEALANPFVAFGRPLVLCIDDLQWADRATIDWLAYYISSQSLPRHLIVGTVRQEEVVEGHPLSWLRWHLMAAGQVTELEVGPLGREETIELATKTAGRPLEDGLAARVVRETEGNPLFVIEGVRMALASAGRNVTGTFLPPRVRAVVEARLDQLSPPARDVAETAAALQSHFTYELLAAASAHSEVKLVSALDELWHRRIVREVDEDAYDFSHAKIREVAYARLSPPRRQMLHRQLALALEKAHAADPGPASGQIAEQFLRAGERRRALDYWIRAAEQAAGLYAYSEAERHYAQAITLASEQPAFHPRLVELYARRGRMLEHAGRLEEAIDLYERLQKLAESRADKATAGLALARLVSSYIKPTAVHNLHAAEPLIAQGLALARAIGDVALEADLLWSQMIRETHYGNTQEARRIGERCLTLVRQHGLKRQLGYVLHDLSMNLRSAGASEQADIYASEAQDLFRQSGNLPMLADSLNQTGWAHLARLEFPAAGAFLAEAHEISRTIHNDWNLAYALWLQGMIAAAEGDWGRALASWHESSQRGQEVGFLMSFTSVPLQLGGLLRQLGDITGARAVHDEAYAASQELAPFMTAAVERELARDAIASGNLEEGQEWLNRARARPVLGDIASAYFLSSMALAETEMALLAGGWSGAAKSVARSLAEAKRRGFRWHEVSLLLAQACCNAALGRPVEAAETLFGILSRAEATAMLPLQWQSRMLLSQLLQQDGDEEAAAREWQAAAAALAGQLAGSLVDEDQRHQFLTRPAVRALQANPAGEMIWPSPLYS